ncbi:hypothetical protein [Clostridium estertheticum]|uniref:Uncharacterized protein n=1 Tax=Clostridium estertheticum subsp. estertheticum TaxID=1552 RepID=A0A1J0GI41_9CLOT|nr:hypothetical protein [Clostridium estertheticum]APC41042.1 hypothetical protein A7L45_13635 [Clostridium estertheticum subsp. estertheticum]
MQNLLNVGTVLGVTLGVVATMLVLFPLIKRKDVKVDEVLQKVDVALNGAGAVIAVADKIMPVNPAFDILKVVEKYVHVGVHQAEQLCINSKLGKDERNAKSKEIIYAALKLLNIEPTEEIDTIINGTIEAETLALGHKDLTEVEKQAQLQKVQVRASQLQVENVQLKQTIATIQGAVQVAQ